MYSCGQNFNTWVWALKTPDLEFASIVFASFADIMVDADFATLDRKGVSDLPTHAVARVFLFHEVTNDLGALTHPAIYT